MLEFSWRTGGGHFFLLKHSRKSKLNSMSWWSARPPRISTLDVVTNSRFEPINRTITYRALDANQ
ncbi:uncharacterized conserved protein, contains double-stranded beta-helix domain [Corynebacterium glutamicum]|nr:uncharacterized conserved protein, contains double-stranded beta-helix domain [Corynebacterium glutamicum]